MPHTAVGSTTAEVAAKVASLVAHRPRLRGVMHLAMAPIAAMMAVPLLQRTSGGERLSVAIFSILLVGLYSTSGSYHVPSWTGRVRTLWGRADTAMIVLFIAGTFTPIAFHTMDGRWRIWSLVVAWLVAIVGAGLAISPVSGPRWLRTTGYLALGWLSVVPFFKIAASLSLAGSALIVLGGVLYSVGGVVYLRRYPNPSPEWFGFHEVFHLLVVAGSICHYIAILHIVV